MPNVVAEIREETKAGVLPPLARRTEYLGPGNKVYDLWSDALDGVYAQQYGSRDNMKLLFDALGIRRGLVVDVCCGERTSIPDIRGLQGVAVDFQDNMLRDAQENLEASRTADTPDVKFIMADVTQDFGIVPRSAAAVVWNGELPFYLRKYAGESDLGGFEAMRESLEGGRMREIQELRRQADPTAGKMLMDLFGDIRNSAAVAIVDKALETSYALVANGGFFISTGSHSMEFVGRLDRLGLKYDRAIIVGCEAGQISKAADVKAVAFQK
jgi:hypothetical protein